MAHRKTERNPLFAGRWFEDDIILLCLRWYFRFKLSYRDLVVILGERGLSISHTTILRWVVRYAETCEKRWRRLERPVGGSWRVDETFIKVRGQLMYLYRAVDGQGNTVEFFLSRTRGIAAAKAFFRKALKYHQEPHSITLDGHRPSHSALRRMGMNGEFNFRGRKPVTIRCCQYLNNVVEQDHRRVKGRLRPMLGFKTFYNARRVIIGIELAQKIHKRQFAIPIPWQSNPHLIAPTILSAPDPPFTVLLCLTGMTLQVHPDYTSSAAGVEAQGEWADQMMYGECLSGHIYHRARLGGAGATGSVPPAFCILLRRDT